jgi:hypothetical protein
MNTKNQITQLTPKPVNEDTKTEMKEIVKRIAELIKEKHS